MVKGTRRAQGDVDAESRDEGTERRATKGACAARARQSCSSASVLIVAIGRTFPELALPRRRTVLRRSLKEASSATRQMSAAGRKAISQRMKRYWAERRKARANMR